MKFGVGKYRVMKFGVGDTKYEIWSGKMQNNEISGWKNAN